MYEFKSFSKLLKSSVNILGICVAAYATAYFLVGEPFVPPNGNVYAVLLVWAAAHLGGFLAVQARVPALLGMLVMGVILRNVPGALLVGYKKSWESRIKTFGLATIMMRAGLKINYAKAFARAPSAVVLLGILPVLAETFMDSAIFFTLFGMPYLLAVVAGFLLSAISPTVIVTGMLDLQKRGLGTARGIPSIEMAAAGMDVVAGIAGYSIFEAISIRAISSKPGDNVAWTIASGPASIAFGIAASALGALILGCTRMWTKPVHRALATFVLGQLFMFVFYTHKMTGAGALATIGTACLASLCWSTGFPRFASLGPEPDARLQVDEYLAIFWMYIMQPLLFGTIGTSVDFKKIPGTTVPKAILVIAVGALSRVLSSMCSVFSAKLSWHETLFVALTWIPKATVQGALSAAPLEAIQRDFDRSSPDYEQYVEWGNQILATCVIAIFMTAPIGLLIINLLGPRMLSKDDSLTLERAKSHESELALADHHSSTEDDDLNQDQLHQYDLHMNEDDPVSLRLRRAQKCHAVSTQTEDDLELQRMVTVPSGELLDDFTDMRIIVAGGLAAQSLATMSQKSTANSLGRMSRDAPNSLGRISREAAKSVGRMSHNPAESLARVSRQPVDPLGRGSRNAAGVQMTTYAPDVSTSMSRQPDSGVGISGRNGDRPLASMSYNPMSESQGRMRKTGSYDNLARVTKNYPLM